MYKCGNLDNFKWVQTWLGCCFQIWPQLHLPWKYLVVLLGPFFLEMFLSDSLFLGGGITGRGGSSGMSGSSLRLIPNTSKGSGDPKPNFIRIINFVCFQRFCSFSKRMHTFSCTRIPHTYAKNGCAVFPNIPAVFPNIPAVFHGGCIVLHGGCAILHKTFIFCHVQELFTKDNYFN